MISKYLLLLLAVFGGMAMAPPLLAENKQGDQNEPIFIEADSLDIDDSKGMSTYSGNVHFRQGTARLWADKVVVHAPERQNVEKLIATGKPARFEQSSVENKEDTWGEAERIEYHAKQSLVVLNGDARLQQGENQFAGSRIEYESDKKVVRAGKLVAGDKGRVQIIIQPRNDNGKKADQ